MSKSIQHIYQISRELIAVYSACIDCYPPAAFDFYNNDASKHYGGFDIPERGECIVMKYDEGVRTSPCIKKSIDQFIGLIQAMECNDWDSPIRLDNSVFRREKI